ncbi:AzlD domain-containing protein [Actinocorallia longicatena]|uniref:AzlD domain-containing protein n=1 Tax=Actinocorallia longicatena TaxID=111803 RepID=A0ABP6QG14_9ACTN
MPVYAIALLAAGTLGFRLAGPMINLPERLSTLLTVAAAVLLVALTVTAAFTEGHDFAGWARPAGVLVAGGLALRRAPFPVIVIAAAVTTAAIRAVMPGA